MKRKIVVHETQVVSSRTMPFYCVSSTMGPNRHCLAMVAVVVGFFLTMAVSSSTVSARLFGTVEAWNRPSSAVVRRQNEWSNRQSSFRRRLGLENGPEGKETGGNVAQRENKEEQPHPSEGSAKKEELSSTPSPRNSTKPEPAADKKEGASGGSGGGKKDAASKAPVPSPTPPSDKNKPGPVKVEEDTKNGTSAVGREPMPKPIIDTKAEKSNNTETTVPPAKKVRQAPPKTEKEDVESPKQGKVKEDNSTSIPPAIAEKSNHTETTVPAKKVGQAPPKTEKEHAESPKQGKVKEDNSTSTPKIKTNSTDTRGGQKQPGGSETAVETKETKKVKDTSTTKEEKAELPSSNTKDSSLVQEKKAAKEGKPSIQEKDSAKNVTEVGKDNVKKDKVDIGTESKMAEQSPKIKDKSSIEEKKSVKENIGPTKEPSTKSGDAGPTKEEKVGSSPESKESLHDKKSEKESNSSTQEKVSAKEDRPPMQEKKSAKDADPSIQEKKSATETAEPAKDASSSMQEKKSAKETTDPAKDNLKKDKVDSNTEASPSAKDTSSVEENTNSEKKVTEPAKDIPKTDREEDGTKQEKPVPSPETKVKKDEIIATDAGLTEKGGNTSETLIKEEKVERSSVEEGGNVVKEPTKRTKESESTLNDTGDGKGENDDGEDPKESAKDEGGGKKAQDNIEKATASGNGTTKDENEKQVPNEPAPVPSSPPAGDIPPPGEILLCEPNKSCEDCMDEAESASSKPELSKTCIWKWKKRSGKCVEVQKTEVTGTEADICDKSGSGNNDASKEPSGGTGGGQDKPASGGNEDKEDNPAGGTENEQTLPPSVGNEEGDDSGGGAIGVIAFLFLLGMGGGIYYAKGKMQLPSPPGGHGGFGDAAAAFGGGARSTKYEQVASDDDDEWGWGDDDNNNEEDDIELAPGYGTDSILHNRRQSSGEIPAFPSKSDTTNNGGSAFSSRLTPSRSPANLAATHLVEMSQVSRIPASPSSTPVKIPELSAIPTYGNTRGDIAKAPISAPAPAIAGPFQTNYQIGAITIPGELPTSIGGMPTRITSLGKSQPSATSSKKPAIPPDEDDIFASMGLAAKPTFSHTPMPTRTVVPAAPSRWTQSAMSTSPSVAATSSLSKITGAARLPPGVGAASINPGPTPSTPPVPVPSAMAYSGFDSGVADDNVDWGDDADLDDLLDD